MIAAGSVIGRARSIVVATRSFNGASTLAQVEVNDGGAIARLFAPGASPRNFFLATLSPLGTTATAFLLRVA
jgi:hypothetical protein